MPRQPADHWTHRLEARLLRALAAGELERHARQAATPGRDVAGQTGDYVFAHGRHPVDRTAIINHLATIYRHRRYLEIGVRRSGDNLDRVAVETTVGVDPDPRAGADFRMTSDAFFAEHSGEPFDLVFIDGAHLGENVYRDIRNALDHLAPGGSIVLHDLNPPTRFHGRRHHHPKLDVKHWNGTSWEGYARMRAERDDLEMCVVDTDWGVGVVRRGRQTPWTGPVKGWSALARHRQALLNLVSVEAFLERYPSPAPVDRA